MISMACNKRKLTFTCEENKKIKGFQDKSPVHDDNPRQCYSCSYCNWMFSSEVTLKAHCNQKHSNMQQDKKKQMLWEDFDHHEHDNQFKAIKDASRQSSIDLIKVSDLNTHNVNKIKVIRMEETSEMIQDSEDSQNSDSEWNPDLSEFCDTQLVIDEASSDTQEIITKTGNLCHAGDAVCSDNETKCNTPQQTMRELITVRYYCKVCNSNFSLKRNCLRHVQVQHPEVRPTYKYIDNRDIEVYQCLICDKHSVSKLQANKHAGVCMILAAATHTVQQDSGHQQSKLKQYLCKECNINITKKYDYLRHIKSFHSEYYQVHHRVNKGMESKNSKTYTCNNCSKIFPTAELITIHFTSKECEVDNAQELKTTVDETTETHQQFTSVTVKRYFCIICNVNFAMKSGSTRHLISYHPEHVNLNKCIETRFTQMYSCNVCSKIIKEHSVTEHVSKCKSASAQINLSVFPSTHGLKTCTAATSTKATDKNVSYDSVTVKRYLCKICSINFTARSSGFRHLTHFHPGFTTSEHLRTEYVQQYVCQECGNMCITPEAAEEHGNVCIIEKYRDLSLLEIANKSQLETSSVIKSQTSQPKVSTPKVEMRPSPRHKCMTCGAYFLALHTCTRHIKQEHPDVHIGQYSSELMYKCSKCCNHFHTQQHFCTRKTHSMAIRNLAACPLCDKLFSRLNNCKRHLKAMHEENAEALCHKVEMKLQTVGICHLCTNKWTMQFYATEKHLKQHMLKHGVHDSASEFSTQVSPNVQENVANLEKSSLDVAEASSSFNIVRNKLLGKLPTSHIKQMHSMLAKKVANISNLNPNSGIDVLTNTVSEHRDETQDTSYTMVLKRLVACPICNKIFPRIDRLKKHVQTEHEQQNFDLLCKNIGTKLHQVLKCQMCDTFNNKVFIDMKSLSQHWLLKHNFMTCGIEANQVSQENQCNLVTEAITSNQTSQDNQCNSVSSENLIKICRKENSNATSRNETFPQFENNFLSHDETKCYSVEVKNVATCPVCNKIYSQANRCKKHFTQCHSQENLKDLYPVIHNSKRTVGICHICPQNCEKMFACKNLLAQHMLKHGIFMSGNEVAAQVTASQREELTVDTTQTNSSEHQRITSSADLSTTISASRTDVMNGSNILIKEARSNKTHSMVTKKVAACPVCSKIFSRLDDCKYHVKTQHSTLQNIDDMYHSIKKKSHDIGICHVCSYNMGKMFLGWNLLKEHMLAHNIDPTAYGETEPCQRQPHKQKKISIDEITPNFNANQDLHSEGFHFLSSLGSQLLPDLQPTANNEDEEINIC